MIRFLRWLFIGGKPDWLPSPADVKRFEQKRPCCTLDGAALPHGNRWWICVSIDPSGVAGAIEARCGALSNPSKKGPAIRTAELSRDEVRWMADLVQQAAKRRGRIKQPLVKDGFPTNVRLLLPSRIIRFRCNLAVSPRESDARFDLAKAMLTLGGGLIDKPVA